MIISKRKILDCLAFIFFVFCSILLAVSKTYSERVIDGIKLWIACILPSFFPYVFITAILSSLKSTGKFCKFISPFFRKVFNVNGLVGYAFTMSIISGYPMGAQIVSDLTKNGNISKSQAERASVLCSTSSPVFLISSVGSIMFNNALFGVLLFTCHLLSALIVGFIFAYPSRQEKIAPDSSLSLKGADNLLYDGIFSAINSVLFVGGVIAIFYLFTEILFDIGALKITSSIFSFIFNSENIGKSLSFGLLESTKGLSLLSQGGVKLLTLPLCALLTGFGGISVICQSLALLKKAQIKTAPFLTSKLVSAVINFILGLIISLIFL